MRTHLFHSAFKTALCALLAAAVLCGCGRGTGNSGSLPAGDFTSVPENSATNQKPSEALSYRAMWISYLDWSAFDTTNADTFAQSAARVYDNCVNLGLNTVIVQVRPFCDAVYPSEYFPWSHILTGTQGQDPGYDPLAILVEQAHQRGLAFEAWINPYRVRVSAALPTELAAQNPALLHPEWTREAEDGLYLNPAIAEVQQYITDGVMEIVNKYDVDGIQFDDYFYPTTDASFDEKEYAAGGGGQPLDEWRRSNVNTLVKTVYSAIKTAKPHCVFGISPQGNNDNNYNGQYSDVKLWLSTPGYVDYIMPQVYWGFGYTLKNGSTQYAFENCIAEWASYPRAQGVSLAIGLGAYRIGDGDGGNNDQSQWASGHNLADMTQKMAQIEGIQGFAVYRYANLYANGNPELAQQEQAALCAALMQ
ncbi:MAG: family 10 glycosylhydrolase [Ruthenibacterium sp.]